MTSKTIKTDNVELSSIKVGDQVNVTLGGSTRVHWSQYCNIFCHGFVVSKITEKAVCFTHRDNEKKFQWIPKARISEVLKHTGKSTMDCVREKMEKGYVGEYDKRPMIWLKDNTTERMNKWQYQFFTMCPDGSERSV